MIKVLLCKSYTDEAEELIRELRASNNKVTVYKYNPPTIKKNLGFCNDKNGISKLDIIDSMLSVRSKDDKYYICNLKSDIVMSSILIQRIKSFTKYTNISENIVLYETHVINNYRNFASVV